MKKEQQEINQEQDEINTSEEEQQEEKVLTKGQKIRNVLLELLIYAAIVVVCVLVVPRYVMQRTIVDGTSMESTLQDADNLLVDKLSYHFSDPKRFDVIVFYPYGRQNEDYYIKRVIGLPGETIQIVGDTIYIDGEVLEENYGKDPMTQSGIAAQPLTLGDDEYFVLGDNRTVSEDSRYEEVGPVSRDKIEGKALLRIYPFSKFGLISSLGKDNENQSSSEDAAVDTGILEEKITVAEKDQEKSNSQKTKDAAGTVMVAAASTVKKNNTDEKNSGSEDTGKKDKTSTGKVVAIDAGHQSRGDSSTEPIGPGSSTRKAKVSGGATGVSSHVPEYKLTLKVAKKLRKELLSRGYEVIMTRTQNDVQISNKQRAKVANKADICIRIHADSSTSSGVTGASALYPSASNPYVGKLSGKSKRLSQCVLNHYCKQTGIKSRGIVVRNDLTGTNWSTIPVTLIEMGFLSNSAEDRLMQKDSTQTKMVKGMADGIDSYFAKK